MTFQAQGGSSPAIDQPLTCVVLHHVVVVAVGRGGRVRELHGRGGRGGRGRGRRMPPRKEVTELVRGRGLHDLSLLLLFPVF